MSLATWKAEFYPTEAKDCPADQAIEHSLVKWRGLRAEALMRHKVGIFNGVVREHEDGNGLPLGSLSCALCAQYTDDTSSNPCVACPLAASRGGVPCDDCTADEAMSPWQSFTGNKTPEPMIAALEKALAEKQEREGANK